MNKRGQINLNFATAVFLTIAAFVITVIIILVIVGSVNDANVFGAAPTFSHAVTNESDLNGNIAFANTTGYTLTRVNGTNSGYAITSLWGDGNQSNGSQMAIDRTPSGFTALIPAANYSVNGTGVVKNATTFIYPNVSVSYTYIETRAAPDGQLATGNLTANVTEGVNTISSKIPTVFTVVAIIIILGAITILVFAWRKLRGGSFG